MQEFVRRGIAGTADELDVDTNYDNSKVSTLDLDELVRSEWLAYQFANQNRTLLRIPRRVSFEVRPRLDVTKDYYHRGDKIEEVRECLFKVSWSETEKNSAGGGLPSKRRIIRGTTLAIDFKTKQVRAILTGGEGEPLRRSRDAFLERLLQRDAVRIGEVMGPDRRPLRGAVTGEVPQGTLRLRATARALHMLEEP
jgi:hypothetical protein